VYSGRKFGFTLFVSGAAQWRSFENRILPISDKIVPKADAEAKSKNRGDEREIRKKLPGNCDHLV
jgi:hypothetical protein